MIGQERSTLSGGPSSPVAENALDHTRLHHTSYPCSTMKHHTVFAGVLCAVCSTFVVTVRAQNERPEGLVAVWGLSTITPARMTNVTRVAAGNDWSLAVGSNGKVLFWGRTSQAGDET